jgi:acetyltransferase-like isoleucine patch superfamily enzyme
MTVPPNASTTAPAASGSYSRNRGLNFGSVLKYVDENGLYLAVRLAVDRIHTIVFSRCIAGKLSHPHGLTIHHSARMRGLKHIEIGRNFSAGRMLWLEAVLAHGLRTYCPRIVIKSDVAVNDFVHIAATKYVEIGNGVLMASQVFIADHNHGTYSHSEQSSPTDPPNLRQVSDSDTVVIEDNVWIGEGATIVAGAHIGQGSVIGANAVVKGYIPAFSIAVGNPARVVKQFDFDLGKWMGHSPRW